jgi:signal transduction histidine kinase/GAF domain-containing protein
MTGSGKSRNDFPLEASVPTGAVPLGSILCTEELRRRPCRPPDYEKENRALVALASALADSQSNILKILAETILDVTQCDSSGLSLLTTHDGGKRFYWPAIAGIWKPHTGGGTPRNFGPCGDVLDCNRTLLFKHFERRYTYLAPIMPAAEECLLVPFYVAGKAVGTIWAIMHDDRRKFDAEDERLMTGLGKFASTAYQALASIDELRFQIREREKAETAVRELANGLEREVRARTQELECSAQELLATNKELEREIAERKRAEHELRRSEGFLAEGQHLSRIGSFCWRVASDEITWSEQFYRIFEFNVGVPVTLELIGTRVYPEDIPLWDDMIGWARRGVSDFEYEHRLLMPDHSIKYLHLIAHGSQDKDGRLEYIGAAQDVTQRRLSEEALSKARSGLAHVARVVSLGVLTASIAHEVNQPLSGIITNSNTCLRMLAAEPANVEGARETARRTIRDGNRASEVIARLRALFAKKEATIESVDLNEATTEVIALSLSGLQRNRVVLRTELADDLPPVMGDRVQLQQVILNLLLNASDSMSAVDDRPRQLLIRTERDERDRVRLTVQDAGVGFDPLAADRLFEAFYTTKNHGMGIGLSVSRSIIESHHGRLWATPNDGPGATFSFSVPRSTEGAARAGSVGAIRKAATTDGA